MKQVPISPRRSFKSIKLFWPNNVCVGCTRSTSLYYKEKRFGFSNVWFESVKYPLCETCQQLEKARASAWREMDSARDRVKIIAAALGVLVGIAGGILSAVNGLGWWGLLIGIVGVIVGVCLGILAGDFVGDRIIGNRHRRRWLAENRQLPNLDNRAIRIASFSYQDKIDGEAHSLYVLECQCDQYADILLTVPYYADLRKMIDGQTPRKV